jgi:type VI protein secretion system component Hcp
MAQGESSDLIMKFVLNGNPIQADSTTNLISTEGKENELLTGFRQGYMFEIDRFTFRAGTSDIESGQGGPANQKTAAKAHPANGAASANHDYSAWRAGKHVKYPVDLQPVTFTRSIDSASQFLIQNCIDSVSYDRATLVKRKAAGSIAAGEIFLRLDFIGVLVTGVDWADGEQVSETCHFICRSVTINYRPQLPDGTLGASKSGFWSMVSNETQPPLA